MSIYVNQQSVFTTFLVTRSMVRGLALHLKRLGRDTMMVFGMDIQPGVIHEQINHFITQHTSYPYVLRVSVSQHGQITCTPRPFIKNHHPLKLMLLPDPRDIACHKSQAALEQSLPARTLAQKKGAHDAVFFKNGHVTEGVTWGIGFIDQNTYILPPPSKDILPSITRELFTPLIAGNTKIERVASHPIQADAAFAFNAVQGIMPVSSIDDVIFNTQHPLIQELEDAYNAL